MVGIAAGMAKCRLVPYVSTFAVFSSTRALEQVRTDLCYQNLNVKIISTHAGLSFGQGGSTHHCTEDIAIMRSMANMKVIVPADGMSAAWAVKAAYESPGPVYIRINRGVDQRIYENMDHGFQIGKAIRLMDGTDVTIIACGSCGYSPWKAGKERLTHSPLTWWNLR